MLRLSTGSVSIGLVRLFVELVCLLASMVVRGFCSILLSVLIVLANSTFEGKFHFIKYERWSIFPIGKEKCSVLAVSFPTF